MFNFSNQDLAMIAIALDDEQTEEKTKRKWINPRVEQRKLTGEYHRLYPILNDDEIKFKQYFRLNKETFENVLSKIEGDLKKKDTNWREAITPREKLAVCLRFLATGDSYKSLALSYRLGCSTTQKIVLEVCDAIIKNLMAQAMPTPSIDDWLQISHDYWTKWNFPNCIGALDGKHVVIQKPTNISFLYSNDEKTYYVALLALVDADHRFIRIDVGSFGEGSESETFANSKICKYLDDEQADFPADSPLPGTDVLVPHVIIANEAFPLKRNLMRPYPDSQTEHNIGKNMFNCRLSKARRVVECAFDILVENFGIYRRYLKAKPSNAKTIIRATCILHNLIHQKAVSDTDDMPRSESIHPMSWRAENATREALDVRDKVTDFFTSPAGSVNDKI